MIRGSVPPFGGPEQVLKYLSRYVHRVAIANSRLSSVGEGQVRFTYLREQPHVGSGSVQQGLSAIRPQAPRPALRTVRSAGGRKNPVR